MGTLRERSGPGRLSRTDRMPRDSTRSTRSTPSPVYRNTGFPPGIRVFKAFNIVIGTIATVTNQDLSFTTHTPGRSTRLLVGQG